MSIKAEPRSIGAITDRVRKANVEIAMLKDGAAATAPGYVLSAEFSVVNAIKYTAPAKHNKQPNEIRYSRKFENESAYNEAQVLIHKAHYAKDTMCSPYINGLSFADPEDFATIDSELAPLREQAHILNDALIHKGGQMRVKIEIYKFLIDASDRRNSIRLAQFIHERLTQLRNMYEDKRPAAYRIAMKNTRNLHKTVTGKQRELVELAIAATENQRPNMIANYGGRKGTLSMLQENGGRVPDFDYTAIDTAIAIFAPSLKFS